MSWLRQTFTDLGDLVFAGGCAGCGGPGTGSVCAGCQQEIAGLVPHPSRPTPAPAGLPPCHALGDYHGVLRELLLAYKERGRYPLALPLGRLLANVVATGLGQPARPVLLVPVPDAPAAARDRYGDHMLRLARTAATELTRSGTPAAVAMALAAHPRVDSVELDAVQRAAQAGSAFRPRVGRIRATADAASRGPAVVLVDDILTTGYTLAACARLLADGGVPVWSAAVLGATVRHSRRIA